MGISIGGLRLDAPVILAPMSGVTDRPFRRLVRALGGGLVVSEMIASREVLHAARSSRRARLDGGDEHPMVVQLAGHEPAVMADAARLCVDRGAAAIDINFGCPVKKVVNRLAGSALMREEDLAARIMEATVRAVGVPVTVKMRTGWDAADRNAPRLARLAEAAGVAMITVHGRTRQQLFQGVADWHFIRRVKQAVRVPVIANGDIANLDDVDRCLAVSGADGVMIGRACQGRPWLIAQAVAHLSAKPPVPNPGAGSLLAIILGHYEAMLEHYGRARGVRIARKHLAWYVKGWPGAGRLRAVLFAAEDPATVRRLLREASAASSERPALGIAA